MLRHLAAALVAFVWSIRYQWVFGIRAVEYKRYWLKAINLALCYQGFADARRNRSFIGAGKSAFFCCVYDVVTDWRNFDPTLFERFESLARQSLKTDEAELAVSLYQQEKNRLLEDGGLSRGIIALEFVTKIMGSESLLRKNTDFDHFGTVMQIVDDVLDEEDDHREHKMNCLLTSKREIYLNTLVKFPVGQMRAILPDGYVLWKVVTTAQKKAEQILFFSTSLPSLDPSVNISHSPYHNINQKDGDKMFSNICE